MMMRPWRAAPALVLLMAAFAPAGGEIDVYRARRGAVMGKISGSIAVLQGAPEPRAYEKFRQSNGFYYLSGVEAAGAFLLIDAVEKRSILFLPPRDARKERWNGPVLFPGEEARKATGVDEVLEAARFEGELVKRKGRTRRILTPLLPEELASTSRDQAAAHDGAQERSPWDGRVSRERAFAQSLKRLWGGEIEVEDLSPILDEMRRVKDAHEVELLRESSRIGAAGMREAIRASAPGMREYQLAAAADFVFRWRGAMGPAYHAITGSGPNSCYLHYSANDRAMEAGDIVVMDFGPDYRYYHSDITRTFPVSDRFSSEQARIYQVVLDAYKAALAKVRPGGTFGDVNAAAREIVTRSGYGQNWIHGASHYVGMSTHDVGSYRPFEPGVVVTVEPGIYFPEKNLGVRIEDTVLVTKDGCEVLSRDVPTELSEIERLKASRGPIQP